MQSREPDSPCSLHFATVYSTSGDDKYKDKDKDKYKDKDKDKYKDTRGQSNRFTLQLAMAYPLSFSVR